MIDVSIVFPVHNESAGIEQFLQNVHKHLLEAPFSYEILCVENGSTDESFEKLKYLAKRNKKIRVLRSPKGWGNAVRTGIDNARGRLTCFMVSDGQVDAGWITKVYDVYTKKNSSMVKIWRTRRENMNRLVMSRLYNLISRTLFGINSFDINATPKIAQTKLLRSLDLKSGNIALDLELLLNLKAQNLSWIEIPAPSQKRKAGSSTTKLRAIVEMLRAIVQFRFGAHV